jgi:hypothetical protein
MADEQDVNATTDTTVDTTSGDDKQQVATPTVEELQAKLAAESSQRLKLEQALTRQGQELGGFRKLAQDAMQRDIQNGGKKDEKVDIFADPDKAMAQAIAANPDVKNLREAAQKMAQQTMASSLKAAHPDFEKTVKDEEFLKWVGASKVRSELYVRGDQNYDFDAANELLTTWNERKALTTTAQQSTQDKTTADLKAAKVTTGTATAGSKKIYKSIDLMRLRQNDPEKYNALNVAQLYANGQVQK